ncbi:hypothetical protein [Pontibacter kalidii]|uniref:hypothetical protein n=1 Tax=Pontibacter kalidii TaxID=2592049 RepID=UPI00224FC56C|nr:hypothetical protein [Pontibacter kalidii]
MMTKIRSRIVLTAGGAAGLVGQTHGHVCQRKGAAPYTCPSCKSIQDARRSAKQNHTSPPGRGFNVYSSMDQFAGRPAAEAAPGNSSNI